MEHRKLDALMTPVERIARVAAAGVNLAKAPQTAPSGAISLDNADGTRTIIGEVVNGEENPSYTMATHVGDTTPPGVPTGITATSKSGVVVVEWDGTLDGGIPDDFFCVRVYLDNVELGALTEAGSVASAKLDGGTTVSITATSEDDCCLPDGTPDHNVSAASQAISITVTSSAAEIIVDVEDEIEGVRQEIADFKGNTYTKAETDKKVQDLDDEISTELTTNYYNKTQIDTNYATKTLVSQTKEEIKLSASQTYATKGESQPNLSPFYAHDLTDIYDATDNPDGYFWNDQASSPELGIVGTQLDDGWMHYELDNSARTGYAYVYPYQRPIASLKPATAYTLLIELRNMVTDAPYSASFRITSQPDDATRISQTVNPNGYDDIYLARGGTFCKALATKPDMSAATLFCRQYIAIAAGKRASFDIRLSLYETVSPELLLDTNAPTLTKVDGPFDRYFSDVSNTQVEMTYGAISDQPEELGPDARYGFTADYDGSYNGYRGRSLAFYSGSTTGDAQPTFMEAGKQYQATWWARVVSGTAYGRAYFINNGTGNAKQPTGDTALPYTSEWRRYTVSMRPVNPSYARAYFTAAFAANKAGKVALCGFSLQEMDATFKPYVTDQTSLSKEYSTKAELRVGLDSVTSEVTKAYESIDATTLAPFSDSVEGYLTSTAAGSATDPLHEPDARKERTSDYFDVTPGASYTFKGKATNESATDWMWRTWRFYDADGKTLGTRQGGNVGKGADEFEVTFTAPDDAASCRVSMTCFEDGRWQVLGDLTKTTADLNSSIKQTADSITSTVDAKLAQTTRNLLMGCVGKEFSNVTWMSDNDVSDGLWRPYHSETTLTATTDGIRADHAGTANGGIAIPLVADGCISAGETLTLSFEYRTNRAPFGAMYVLNAATPNVSQGAPADLVADGEWHAFEHTWTAKGNAQVPRALLISYYKQAGAWIEIKDGSCLLTRGESYTRSTTFKQTTTSLDGRITATEDGLAVQETLIRQYANGVLVCKVGEAVGALVNASGSFDVVSVTWSGNNPTVGTTMAQFTATDLLLGLQANDASVSLLGGTGSLSASNDWTKEQSYGLTLRGPNALGVHTGSSRAVGISMEKSFERRIIDPTQPPTAADTSTLSINAPQPSISYGSEYRLVFAKKLWDETSKEYTIPGAFVNLTVPDSGVFGTTGLQVGGFHDGTAQWPSGTSMRGIFFGTTVVSFSGTTKQVWTSAQFATQFGRAPKLGDQVIFTSGDAGASAGLLVSSEMNLSNGATVTGVTARLSGSKSGAVRLNYLVILGA